MSRDQASALQQVGFLPECVPTPQGRLRLPVAGYESAKMLVDESTGEANFMFGNAWGMQAGENGNGTGHANGQMHN